MLDGDGVISFIVRTSLRPARRALGGTRRRQDKVWFAGVGPGRTGHRNQDRMPGTVSQPSTRHKSSSTFFDLLLVLLQYYPHGSASSALAFNLNLSLMDQRCIYFPCPWGPPRFINGSTRSTHGAHLHSLMDRRGLQDWTREEIGKLGPHLIVWLFS